MLPISGGEGRSSEPTPAADPWPALWQAFLAWPGLSAQASEPLARLAWQRSVDVTPAEFIGCIAAHGRKLAAENEARGHRLGKMPCVHPHNWIERDQGWRAYLGQLRDAATPRPTTLTPDDVFRLRQAGFEDPDIAAWFADGEFLDAETFAAATEFKRNWIRSKFGARLERVDILNIIVRAESKAA